MPTYASTYELLQAPDFPTLAALVNTAIEAGWVVSGSLVQVPSAFCNGNNRFCQPMTLYNPPSGASSGEAWNVISMVGTTYQILVASSLTALAQMISAVYAENITLDSGVNQVTVRQDFIFAPTQFGGNSVAVVMY